MKEERTGGRKEQEDRISERGFGGVTGRTGTQIIFQRKTISFQKQLSIVSYNFPFIEVQEGSYGEASFRDDDFPRCLMD